MKPVLHTMFLLHSTLITMVIKQLFGKYLPLPLDCNFHKIVIVPALFSALSQALSTVRA